MYGYIMPRIIFIVHNAADFAGLTIPSPTHLFNWDIVFLMLYFCFFMFISSWFVIILVYV